MMNTQLMDAPATAASHTSDTPARGAHLLEHPRGRGFSVVSRLAREVQPSTEAPRHRRDDAGPERVDRTA
jgi:hypothetical protein